MRIKDFFLLSFFLLLLSCSNQTSNKQEETKVQGSEIEEKKSTKTNEDKVAVEEKTKLKLVIEKVNIQAIKAKFINSNTSAKLSSQEGKNYLPNTEFAFFGKYFFTNEKNKIPFVANTVVAVSKDGKWDYSNSSEEVVEFTTYSNQANPFNEVIQIGQSKNSLVEILGKEHESKQNNLIYQDSFGNVACVYIQNDTVKAIKVGRYKITEQIQPIVPR